MADEDHRIAVSHPCQGRWLCAAGCMIPCNVLQASEGLPGWVLSSGSMQALQDTGLEGHPQDYLMFFALVNRETRQPDDVQQPQRPPAHGLQVSQLRLHDRD